MRILVLAVAVIVAFAGLAFAKGQEAEDKKDGCPRQQIQITCENETVVKVPAWQRVLTLGVLGPERTVERKYSLESIGGLDGFRCLYQRNRDAGALIGGFIRAFRPEVVSVSERCEAPGQKSMLVNFDGVSLAIDEDDSNGGAL